ncbi:Crp/Fnr family transcriptional regulator [Candidatus Formimonas warabiya]|uniref:Crp/Fnr family transcriptional regulator n=1 Tax=Formimonas warabiya TaxID=1761012 RepID=A0A3G1KXR8_FORW1|nr:Crp/Fnr family transcriptional regulator [Candidatus Formimonas warabiya]ATW27278.1 hypothetical protein DCMF_23235 [Candidatus Formimonas warabiya]
MEQYLSVLQNCLLFRNMGIGEIEEMMKSPRNRIVDYPADAVIAVEGDNCSALGILLAGKIEIQKIYSSGKTVTVAQFRQGNIFGEAIIFSQHHQYPGTVISRTPARILFVQRETIVALCSQYPRALENFMELLSERILLLNQKIKQLSLGTIRQKICHFLLEEHKKQKSLVIQLDLSKEALAEHMGIQRPSLSREFMKMRDEGLIRFKKNRIEIPNPKQLEEFL